MNTNNAVVLWFTGLSGSGKTTISQGLKSCLEQKDKKVLVLDGDVIRETLHISLGFSREDIRKNNRFIAELSKKQLKDFDYILVPIISPYIKDRIMVKKIIGDNNFLELFIKLPLKKCIDRDPKGLYQKALIGEIDNFIGISETNPYQEPKNPDLIINTEKMNIKQSLSYAMDFLEGKRN